MIGPAVDNETLESARRRLDKENRDFKIMADEMITMIRDRQSETRKLVKKEQELRQQRAKLIAKCDDYRASITRRRSKSSGDDLTPKEALRAALPIFTQNLARYYLEGKKATVLPISVLFPSGMVSKSVRPRSQVSIKLRSANSEKTVEQLAGEGGKLTIIFNVKSHTHDMDDLILTAKKYFEAHSEERSKSLDAPKPEISTELVGSKLIITVKLSAQRDQVGRLLERARSEIMHEFSTSDKKKDSKHPIFGKYKEEDVKEALKTVASSKFDANFVFDSPFDDLFHNGELNWMFLNKLTGRVDIEMERNLYRTLQKVAKVFSTIAATKMSLGGKMFKKLKFEADGCIFRSFMEDPKIQKSISEVIHRAMGHRMLITDEILQNLTLLNDCIGGLDQVLCELPSLNLDIQFKGMNFFQIALAAAQLALEKK
eukprot:TRINITY_DN3048_c0_g1_i1.p1 TRINITY_DN3048_c0_g1~~TRINITY_DN3048_c0_g1_i1.p1  ORF type:complete len:455 (+),score=89.55 TRINITY_DN3048_c0_g1_i1:79-1365(+)